MAKNIEKRKRKGFSLFKVIMIVFLVFFIVFTSVQIWSCRRDKAFGEKPEGFDDPMPMEWETILSGKAFDFSSIENIKEVTEITIGADITKLGVNGFNEMENLENICVEEGNEVFVSDNGILYSKSYRTLYRWPVKKQVTEVRETVEFFDVYCFYKCDFIEGFEIPDETITIGAYAFLESNLTRIHIKENVKSVGADYYSEDNKERISHYSLPQSCRTVEISAPIVYPSFYMNLTYNYREPDIDTIIFNEGVRQIRADKEQQHSNPYKHKIFHAKTITFPSTLEAISDVYFPVNIKVASYTIPESVTYLAEYAFDDYYSKISLWDRIRVKFNRLFIESYLFKREATTEFDCKNQLAKDYISSKESKWEKNKKNNYK